MGVMTLDIRVDRIDKVHVCGPMNACRYASFHMKMRGTWERSFLGKHEG